MRSSCEGAPFHLILYAHTLEHETADKLKDVTFKRGGRVNEVGGYTNDG